MSDVTQLSLATLSAHLTQRKFSASDLVEAYHRRIERWNPALNVFREVDIERTYDQAKVTDARKRRLSPLDGIPIAAKGNIDIEGLITRSGLGARAEKPATEDAAVIKKLRAAGAIILGHTNMHEGALGATNDNPHDGQTHNPWRPNHTPGGSSGGSAAAVTARLCPLALGTDTMGSIRLPAAYCGVAGYKPGRGMLSNQGVEPLLPAFDQVGPIARAAADLRFWFEAMTSTPTSPDKVDLRARRLGLLANLEEIDLEDDVRLAFDNVMDRIKHAISNITKVTLDGFDPGQVRRAGLLLIEAEAADHFRADRQNYPAAFSSSFQAMLDYGANADADRLTKAKTLLIEIGKSFEALFKKTDLLLVPTTPQVAFSFDDPVPSNQADLTALANIAGAPAVSLPIALDRNGLPIGLQVVGHRGADALVLEAAAVIETMIGFTLPDLPHGDWP